MTYPSEIDGARVIRAARFVVPRGTPTNHRVGGEPVAQFSGVYIARYEADPGYYLFYCNHDGKVVTDTYHDSLEAAVEQATFEFGSVEFEYVAEDRP